MTPVDWICFVLLALLSIMFYRDGRLHHANGMPLACTVQMVMSGFFTTIAVGVLLS